MTRTAGKQASKKIAIIVKGWPRLSETFIAQELLALQEAGLVFDIISLRKPHDSAQHPCHERMRQQVIYLPEYIYQAPFLFLFCFIKSFFVFPQKRFWKVLVKTLLKDFSPNRLRRFAQAIIFAAKYGRAYDYIYCHFLHTPTSVGYYASLLLEKKFAFSAHAKDIWTSPEWDIRAKVEAADWGTTCTQYGADFLRGLSQNPKKIKLIYHGLDFKALPKIKRASLFSLKKVQLLSVGRAVEKKGFDILLQALADLPDDFLYEWVHIGGGELVDKLKLYAENLGIAAHIKWLGPQSQKAVFNAYAKADIFILPCRVASDGDRDGLPNVLMEASFVGLPIITTPVSGIVECFSHLENAYLVPENDIKALSHAIYSLGNSKDLCQSMAENAKEKIKHFDFKIGFSALKKCFSRFLR